MDSNVVVLVFLFVLFIALFLIQSGMIKIGGHYQEIVYPENTHFIKLIFSNYDDKNESHELWNIFTAYDNTAKNHSSIYMIKLANYPQPYTKFNNNVPEPEYVIVFEKNDSFIADFLPEKDRFAIFGIRNADKSSTPYYMYGTDLYLSNFNFDKIKKQPHSWCICITGHGGLDEYEDILTYGGFTVKEYKRFIDLFNYENNINGILFVITCIVTTRDLEKIYDKKYSFYITVASVDGEMVGGDKFLYSAIVLDNISYYNIFYNDWMHIHSQKNVKSYIISTICHTMSNIYGNRAVSIREPYRDYFYRPCKTDDIGSYKHLVTTKKYKFKNNAVHLFSLLTKSIKCDHLNSIILMEQPNILNEMKRVNYIEINCEKGNKNQKPFNFIKWLHYWSPYGKKQLRIYVDMLKIDQKEYRNLFIHAQYFSQNRANDHIICHYSYMYENESKTEITPVHMTYKITGYSKHPSTINAEEINFGDDLYEELLRNNAPVLDILSDWCTTADCACFNYYSTNLAIQNMNEYYYDVENTLNGMRRFIYKVVLPLDCTKIFVSAFANDVIFIIVMNRNEIYSYEITAPETSTSIQVIRTHVTEKDANSRSATLNISRMTLLQHLNENYNSHIIMTSDRIKEFVEYMHENNN